MWTKVLYRVTQACILLVLASAPFPFGCVHAVSRAILATVVLALLAGWGVRAVGERRLFRGLLRLDESYKLCARGARAALGCCGAVVLIVMCQVTPLPEGIASPLGRRATAARQRAARDLAAVMSPAFATVGAGGSGAAGAFGRWTTVSIDPARTLGGALLVATYVGMFLLVLGHFRTRGEFVALASTVALACAALSAHGIVQQVLSPERIYGVWKPQQGGRPFGPFINENHFGGYLAMGIPVTMALAIGLRYRRLPREADRPGRGRGRPSMGPAAGWALGLAVAAMMMAVIMSRSRGGLLALMVAMVFMLVLFAARRRREGQGPARMMIMVVLLCVAGAGWFAGRVADPLVSGAGTALEDAWARVRLWRPFLRIGRDFTPLGVGVGAFGSVSSAYDYPSGPMEVLGADRWYRHAENDYVEVFAETGPAGLAAVVVLAWAIFYAAWHAWRLSEQSRLRLALLMGALGGVVAALAHSVCDFSLRIPSNGLLGASLGAACLSLSLSLSKDWGSYRDDSERRVRGRRRAGMRSLLRSVGRATARPVWGVAAGGLFVAAFSVAAVLGWRGAAAGGYARRARQLLAEEPAQAVRLLENGLRVAWRDSKIHLALGSALEAGGTTIREKDTMAERAIGHYATAAWLEPFDSEARLLLGRALMRSVLRAEASEEEASLRKRLGIGQLAEAHRLEPRSFEIRLALAAAYKAGGFTEMAKGWLRSLFRDFPQQWDRIIAGLELTAVEMVMLRDVIPQDALSRYRLAEFYRQRGLTAFAREEYRQACEGSRPSDSEVRIRSAEALSRLGEAEASLAFLDRWVRDVPSEPAYRTARAELLARMGRLPQAIADAQSGVDRAPVSWEARRLLATLYERNGQPQAAEEQFRKALEQAPRNADAYGELARFYRRQKRLDDAARVTRNRAEVFPRDARCRIELGELYYELHDYPRSIRSYQEALERGASREEVEPRIAGARKANSGVKLLTAEPETPQDRLEQRLKQMKP